MSRNPVACVKISQGQVFTFENQVKNIKGLPLRSKAKNFPYKKYPGKPVKTGIFLAGNILVKACKSMGIMAAIVKVWVLWLIWRPIFYKFFPGLPGLITAIPVNSGFSQ